MAPPYEACEWRAARLLLLSLAFLPAFTSAGDAPIDTALECSDVRDARELTGGNMSVCEYAENVCDNSYTAMYFCADGSVKIFLLLIFLVWIGMLFVLLGSTADDYFSPALEQFSTKLGLPPRFAGVTLLALGNGAPDVSATISAIRQGGTGYQLSLGALTGAGMFVGTVVAGVVMLIADGVKARGALIRDLSMYVLTCSTVMTMFLSGEMTSGKVTLLLSMYFVFIVVVLIADIFHRTVTLPRQRAAAQRGIPGQAGGAYGAGGETTIEGGAIAMLNMLRTTFDERDDKEMAFGEVELDALGSSRGGSDRSIGSGTGSGTGSGSGSGTEHQHISRRAQYVIMHADDAHDEAMQAGGTDDGYVSLSPDGNEGAGVLPAAFDSSSNKQLSVNGSGGAGSSLLDADGGNTEGGEDEEDPNMSMIGRLKIELTEAWEDFKEAGAFNRIPMAVELPFTLLRKATVPLTAEDAYSKPWLVISTAMTPFWISYYLERDGIMMWDVMLFGGTSIMIPLLVISFGGALAIAHYAKDNEPPPVIVSAPLALVGFMVAASWIDIVADQLVSMLTFGGLLLSIPDSVLGLTVLAWGNSIGDLSTNMAMAKKGLSNMAITACYAGPVFNMLVGIGVGFATLLSAEGKHSTPVELSPGLLAGLSFLITNCILLIGFGIFNKNVVPGKYGYACVAIYATYIFVSFILLFGMKD